MSPGPLTGVRVVELAGIGPAPFACMLLAELGADVIKVDRPDGGGLRIPSEYDLLNRGRPSVCVDLRQPDGVGVVRRLVDSADVFIEGYRPGVAERLGLGPQDLWERRPALVYGRMTGWGQTGPVRQRAGLTPPRHPAVDQRGSSLPEVLRPETEALGDTWPISLDEDVRRVHQPAYDADAVGLPQVDADAGTASVEQVVLGRDAEAAAVRSVDLDDVGTELRQQHAGERCWADAGELDHAHTGEGAWGHGRNSLCLLYTSPS